MNNPKKDPNQSKQIPQTRKKGVTVSADSLFLCLCWLLNISAI